MMYQEDEEEAVEDEASISNVVLFAEADAEVEDGVPEEEEGSEHYAVLPFQGDELLEMERLENACSGEVVTTFGWLANPSGTGKTVTMASYLNSRGSLRIPFAEKKYSHVQTTGVRSTSLSVQKVRTYSNDYNPDHLSETVATLWVCSMFELERVKNALRTFAPDLRFAILRRLSDVKRLTVGGGGAGAGGGVTAASFSEDDLVECIERRSISVVVVLDSFLTNYRRVLQRVAWNRIVASNLFRNRAIVNAFSNDSFVRRFLWVLQGVPEVFCTNERASLSRVSIPGVRLGVFDALQKSGTLASVTVRTVNLRIMDELRTEFVVVSETPSAPPAETAAIEENCVQQRADKILHDISFSAGGMTYRFATKRAWLIDEARRSLDFLNIRGMQTVDDVVGFLTDDVVSAAAAASSTPEDVQAFQGKLARLQRPQTEPNECPVCLTSEEGGGGEGTPADSSSSIGKKFVTIRSCHHKLCSTCCAILVTRSSPIVCPSCRQDFNAMDVVVSTGDVISEAEAVDGLRQTEIASFGRLESRQDRVVRAVRSILAANPDANVVVTVENIEQTRHNLLYDLPFTDAELERVWTIGLCDTSFLLDASMSAPAGVKLSDVTHIVSCFSIQNLYGFKMVLSDFCIGFKKVVNIIQIQ